MKIIYYSPHPTHDIVSEVGYATHQREVILALRQAGHELFPVVMGGTSPEDLNPLARESYRPSFGKKLFKSIIPRFLWTTLNNRNLLMHDKRAEKILEEAILKYKPDLLYERSEYLQASGARMAEKYSLRYFLEVNAPFVEEMGVFEGYSLYHSMAHRIEAYKLKTATKVFSVSSALSGFLSKRYGCNPDKIILQPNCINPDKIHINPNVVETLRSTWQAEQGQLIGFVGSMFPYHGVDLLIRAFASVHREYPRAKLLIVGDGSVLQALRELANSLSIGGSVVFTGRVPHSKVFDYIAAMDLCVMARSNWYGSPVKIFEYGLMCKPVIAPDTAPVRDVIQHGTDAYITEDTEKGLVKALSVLLSDPKYAGTLASHFHKRVLAEYTWAHAATKIIQSCT